MSSLPNRNILIITGELSGEIHAAHLVSFLGEKLPFTFTAMGARRLAEAGAEIIYDYSDISVTGLSEIFSKLSRFWTAFRVIKGYLRDKKPALVILVDFGGFNLRIARFAKSLGVPVIYFIPPQIWASRRNRIYTIRNCVDKVISILPFEKALYDTVGVDAVYVGHPFATTVKPTLSREAFRELAGITSDAPVFTIMPGSRRNEFYKLMPVLLDTLDVMRQSIPGLHVILPLADSIDLKALAAFEPRTGGITVMRNHAHDALSYCDLAIVASGSVTLEAAVLRTPTIVIYRMSSLSYMLARLLVKVQWISLPNIIAGKEVFPEFIQDLNPTRIAQRALSMLHNGCEEINEDIDGIVTKLGDFDSYALSGDAVIAFLEKRYGPIPETA